MTPGRNVTGTATPARVHRRAAALALAAATVLGAGPGAAEETSGRDASYWLDRMMHATRSLNYDGTFVYRKGEHMESMRIVHRAGPDGERERLVSLSGAAREVIRDESRVTCILPDSASVVVSKSRPRSLLPAGVSGASEDIERYYSLAVEEGDRVAGRETQVIVVEPRDRYRYGYRLWLDRGTGLLLKSELVHDSRMPIEQIVYTSISTPDRIADELLEPEHSGEGFTWYTTEGNDATASGREAKWDVEWLPDGFEMSERAFDPVATSRMPVEQMVYSDGLATVSVFVEELAPGGERLEGASRMGAMNAYGRVVGDYQITTVGEVPPATVEGVARSVVHR